MINEHSSTQASTPTSANMQYGYPPNRFDLMNMSPMQNPNDLYSYYPTSLYQPFGTFDEHNQWGSTDSSTNFPPSGPLQFHPSMYPLPPPSGLDISRNLFDYPPPPPPPPPHAYPSYQLGFTPPTGDMPWNSHQQQMPLIGSKKLSIYDEYPSSNNAVSEMLAQQISSVNLGNNDINNRSNFSSKEQQLYSSNSTHPSLTRPSGPKSYASVVSSDTINSTNNKTIRSPSNLSNDSFPTRHTRYQPQSSSSSSNGGLLNWTNKTSEHSSNSKSSRGNHPPSTDSNPQYNPKDFTFNPKGARFFVIKSYSEDDVHRSIKYNIWCSTEHGNKRLDTAFREREGKGPIYLFYSVNASGHFCGMAEMMSPLDYEHQTDVWHMSNKWQGKFEVKWIYVKDVPNQQFRNIRLENNENKPVTNSRDTQEIPYEKGKLMLKTLHMYRHKTSIFDDFQYYESKQAEEITTKQPTDQDWNTNNDSNHHQHHHHSRRQRLGQQQEDNPDE